MNGEPAPPAHRLQKPPVAGDCIVIRPTKPNEDRFSVDHAITRKEKAKFKQIKQHTSKRQINRTNKFTSAATARAHYQALIPSYNNIIIVSVISDNDNNNNTRSVA